MLNELTQLAVALDYAGISPKEWSPFLKPLPKVGNKNPCFHIFIGKDNNIKNIDLVNPDVAVLLRKYEPSNGNSFPGFNIQPLFRLTGDEQKKKLKDWRDAKEPINFKILKEWCSKDNENWSDKTFLKIKKCLVEIPKAFLSKVDSEKQSNSDVIKLIERCINLQTNNEFQRKLEFYIWEKFEKGESVKILLPLLVYEGDVKKEKSKDTGSISVFLDIPDWKDFPVTHKKSIEWLNEILVTDHNYDAGSSGDLDAYCKILENASAKLPEVKLPVIANVKLRAMNSESPCQTRYNTIDAESFPVGQESRKLAKGALEWLGDESREGETWGRADGRELVFAYPSILPEVPLKITACFGSHKSNNTEARFADAAQDVIKGLKGISKDLKNLHLNVFSLKKMDKARTKVVFYRNYSAQRLADAANEWQAGCENIPDISIRAWTDKKGEWDTHKPVTPYPLQIAKCLNRVWKIDGTTECETPVIANSRGIELLLEEQSEIFVPHLLTVLLQNSKGLLLFLGGALNRNEIVSLKGLDIHKILIPSILGLLLYKLNHKKEVYMNNTPFLVGRMLKLADELHALYCKEVRENNLPPQLIGNTLMTAALESPEQALSQLALRLKPYYGWARTFQKGENAKLAGYFIGLYANTASQLAGLKLPSRFNDADRAQVLLGYLASNPKKSDKPDSSDSN
ncbi:MAG: hypothetical protein JW864_04985 [Spirochaetes bacterium]|nr:hypothetical protein [Spirochaetota bacterium]